MEPLEVSAVSGSPGTPTVDSARVCPCTPPEERQKEWEEAWHSQQPASLPRQPEIVGRKATASAFLGRDQVPAHPDHQAHPGHRAEKRGWGRREQPLSDLRRNSHLSGEVFTLKKGRRLCENCINLN